ncbi:PAS domain-containing protein [Roseiconus nitratireducens]|uniref:histidine kinase n=1 Tax=Roseiconus nitratireducens TaxID=2605748 RepID=A0A5M6D9M3_9BACT|nr:chemotaxis protein CheB [Roseiconus nitratireducens]KAA5542639.1 PAS domain-containing protein [Roseiconus nitratireducens]
MASEPLQSAEQQLSKLQSEGHQSEQPAVERDRPGIHVVGVGASAGGLEALEELFSVLPTDSGMAFVVIQHLSPDFKSHMQQLLGRKTKMPVHRVENGMRVDSNAVYLIPPRKEMVISSGKLLLTEKATDGSLSHPIDQFFRSLASDVQKKAIGVVLSGTGSDGSRGIQHIHEAGGFVLAQDANSARFDGMPLSAAATGCVDVVAEPAAIAEALLRYTRDGWNAERIAASTLMAGRSEGIDRIFELLQQQHGLDFSFYKSSTVGRRIQRRLELSRSKSIEQYIAQIENNPGEINDLYKDLLIGVTKFFRDRAAFETLESQVIPKLFSGKDRQDTIRVWVAGCASGEEAYSIAILIDEEMRRRGQNLEVKIFATDAHHGSLSIGARGVYPPDSMSEMSADRKQRYFLQKRDGYHVRSELRRNVIFAPHNLLEDAPFTQMDLVTCRNLLIYLQAPAQKKALSLFHFALKSGGTLFLGPSETTGELSDEFGELDKRWRIYSKRRDVRLPLEPSLKMNMPTDTRQRGAVAVHRGGVESALLATYDVLLDRKMPPSILVDETHEILHVFGGAQRYLQYTSGRPSNNLLDSILPSLKTPLTGALQHAKRKGELARYTGLQISTDAGVENLQLTVEPIQNPAKGIDNLLVEIHAVAARNENPVSETAVDVGKLSQDRIDHLETDLRYAQENLQATIEEMETSNEELQATNEELTASNEELQSTNEELHSVNEELYTVNAEHQRRVEELTQANNDMDNLLATTRVGVIFLDSEFCIRRFTPEVARVFHLVPQDVGRSIKGFVHNLNYGRLLEDLEEVFESREEKEVNIYDRQGTAFLLRMLPYRSGDEVEGVVLTLIDVQSLVDARRELEKFRYMAESAMDLFVLADARGKMLYVNPVVTTLLGYQSDDLVGQSLAVIDQSMNNSRVSQMLSQCESTGIAPFESRLRRQDDEEIFVEISVSSVSFGSQQFLFATMRDLTARRRDEQQLRLQYKAIESAVNGILICDVRQHDCPIIYANPGFYEMTGYSPEETLGKNCRFLQGERTDRQKVAELRESIHEGKRCVVTLLNYRKDGSPFWNELQLTPVHEGDGTLTHFVGVQHDVTAQREAQEKLKRANETLANKQAALRASQQRALAASETKSEFLANMSHELRTPMTAVLGFADMLRAETDDSNAIEKIDTITRNGKYLLSLLNDILDLSKIEAGKLDIDNESVNVAQVIEDVADLMHVRARQEGIPLIVEFQSEVPREVTADRVRVRQILVNLIGNALKFTDEGEVRVTIALERNSDAESNGSGAADLVVRVADTGIGMSDEQLQDLFQPFTQGSHRAKRKYGGTGLGLSISKRLVDAMGGDIQVESRKGNGSVFTLRLPVTAEQLSQLVRPSPERPERTQRESTFRFPQIHARVLLADDRRDIWRVVKYFMEKCGAEVVVTEDGRQAVDAARAAREEGHPFKLILMDMQMPVMTGKEAVIKLRQDGFDVPIIALTADAMDGEREACIDFGCTDYIAKPVDGRRLVKMVDRLMREGSNQVAQADGGS